MKRKVINSICISNKRIKPNENSYNILKLPNEILTTILELVFIFHMKDNKIPNILFLDELSKVCKHFKEIIDCNVRTTFNIEKNCISRFTFSNFVNTHNEITNKLPIFFDSNNTKNELDEGIKTLQINKFSNIKIFHSNQIKISQKGKVILKYDIYNTPHFGIGSYEFLDKHDYVSNLIPKKYVKIIKSLIDGNFEFNELIDKIGILYDSNKNLSCFDLYFNSKMNNDKYNTYVEENNVLGLVLHNIFEMHNIESFDLKGKIKICDEDKITKYEFYNNKNTNIKCCMDCMHHYTENSGNWSPFSRKSNDIYTQCLPFNISRVKINYEKYMFNGKGRIFYKVDFCSGKHLVYSSDCLYIRSIYFENTNGYYYHFNVHYDETIINVVVNKWRNHNCRSITDKPVLTIETKEIEETFKILNNLILDNFDPELTQTKLLQLKT